MTEILRGETPEDIDQKCVDVCSKFLDGIWRDITADKIVVKRIGGGFTNLLFYCGLNDDIQTIGSEPKEVFIRFYGKKWIKDNDNEEDIRLSDAVISLLASEHKLGPKIYGLFNSGQIGEYIHSHHLDIEEQKNPRLMKELARKLARFHYLSVPQAQDRKWHIRAFYDLYGKAFAETPNQNEMIAEINAKNLLETDLKEENEWLFECMDRMNSPIVYSHNDFFAGNILVKNRLDEENDNNITLIDFEYSRHFYRGFDLGFLINELGRNSDWIHRENIPLASDEAIETILKEYLDESIKINGKEFAEKEENSLTYLVRESKFFILTAEMFILVFLHYTPELPTFSDRKTILKKMDEYYGWYIQRRIKFEKEGILPMPRYKR